jgi:putative hydrolase of the HAD superfamily
MGGVLIDLDPKACIRAFLDILGYERIKELIDPYHQKGIYGELEEGAISADEFRAAILAESRPGSRPEDVDRCVDAMISGMEPYKADLLRTLSQKYPLYLLSNNNELARIRFHKILSDLGLDWRSVFREEFCSFQMKMLKPDPEFFREAVRRIGLPPEEIYYVDDSPVNVEAARAVGINAVLCPQGDDLRSVFEGF